MASDKKWEARLEETRTSPDPFMGHPLLPIPLRSNKARTERVSTYVEWDLLKFFEQYGARGGFRSVSEVLRRLAILGAQAEGYQFDESTMQDNQIGGTK
jgi:hypothetical protein